MLLAVIMLMGALPVAVFAQDTPMTITVESVNAMPGETVEVDIILADNPGVSSLRFNVRYGGILTLMSVKYNSEFEGQFVDPQTMSNPVTLTWLNPFGECDINGVFATLKFSVSDSAQADTIAPITVTYDPDDIYNMNEDNVDCNVNAGQVTVLPCVPGDINGDGKSNNKDATRLAQFLAEWDVDINAHCVDVNGDGKVNNKDLTRLFQYLANWDVEIWCKCGATKRCIHEMTEYPANAASCTEDGNIDYWYCELCQKYFLDADGAAQTTYDAVVIKAYGHTEVVIPAVAPTYEEGGWTEGKECSVCGTVILEPIYREPLAKDYYLIEYKLNDTYLDSIGVENLNADRYSKQDGYELVDVEAKGYKFLGWYTKASGGELVEQIPAGTTGNKVYYAHWEKFTYTVQFDSPDIPWDNNGKNTYTVDTGLPLDNPSCYGYTFVGWSVDGQIINSIEPGTTGHITLHANWTSNRNQAKALPTLSDPEIIEDMDNGQYLFVYELGRIENVPIKNVRTFTGNLTGLDVTDSFTVSNKVGEGFEDTMAETVSNATTKTSSWTLSEEWTESASAVNAHEEEKGKTEGVTDTEGKTTGQKYYVGNSTGGDTSVSSSSGGSASVSAKVTRDVSKGISGTYTDSHSETSSVEIEAGLSAEIGVEDSGISGKLGVSLKATQTETTVDTTTREVSKNRTQSLGTSEEFSETADWNVSSSTSSSWNSEESYEQSSTTERTTEVSSVVSDVINDRWEYSSTQERGEGKSTTAATDESQELSKEYVSRVEYTNETETTYETTETYKSDAPGYYRIVTAGTIHVFGVVGYDIATNAYYTYTYNVLDKERNLYLDYSKNTALFDDCENGIIPFEIPYTVHEFISSVVRRTEGLTIDEETGLVTKYTGDSEYVVIPEYASFDHGYGSYGFVRVRGIKEGAIINGEYTPGAFEGNESIKAVILPKYVSGICNNAFRGCTSLETIFGYNITTIGNNAFDGCTSLKEFDVDKYFTELGTNAFVNVPAVNVQASDRVIADNTLGCGALSISLDVSEITDGYNDKIITVDEGVNSFTFISNGKATENLRIVSNAKRTEIVNVNFAVNYGVPLDINSETLILNRVTVQDAPGFALKLSKDNAELYLYGNSRLSTKGDNAVISRSVTFKELNSNDGGLLYLTGNYLVCGDIVDNNLIVFNDYPAHKIESIDEAEYDRLFNYIMVTLDADGGSVSPTVVYLPYGGTYAGLPTPTKENYDFLGWFAEGLWATENTDVLPYDHTLKAGWYPSMFYITFDGNGGTVSTDKRAYRYESAYGSFPEATREKYTFDGWYTVAEGGTLVTEDMMPESATDFTLYAHWKLAEYTVTFDANGGTVETESIKVMNGETYGELPVPVKENCTFDGWYTEGGEQVTADTVYSLYEDVTLRAYWITDWVLASELQLPEGAEIVEEEWRYTLTEKERSTSASLDGWTWVSSEWVETKRGTHYYSSYPGGFSTGHSLYSKYAKSALSSYENDKTKRSVSGGSFYTYIYYHWCRGNDSLNLNNNRTVWHSYTSTYTTFDAFESSSDASSFWDSDSACYMYTYRNSGCCGDSYYYYRFNINKQTYIDYEKWHNFVRETELRSDTEIAESDSISNVQKWVQYRAK